MKALTANLELLRAFLWEMPEATDAEKRHKQAALDIWIETNAVAEALPEIQLTLGVDVQRDGREVAAQVRKPPEPIAHLRHPAYGPGSITDAATYEKCGGGILGCGGGPHCTSDHK